MDKDERVSIKPDITFIQKAWQNIAKCSDQSEEMVHELGKVGSLFDVDTRGDVVMAIDYSIDLDKTVLKMSDSMKDHLRLGIIMPSIYSVSYSEFREMSSNYIMHYKQARKYYDLFYEGYDAVAKGGYVAFYPYISEIEHDGKMSFLGEFFKSLDPAPYASSRPVTRVNTPVVNVPHESTNVSHDPARVNVPQSSTISKATAAPVQNTAPPREETNTKSTSQSPVETPTQNNETSNTTQVLKTSRNTIVKGPKSMALAVILSIFLPGLGYFYAGKKIGLAFFIITLIFCWSIIVPIAVIIIGLCLSYTLVEEHNRVWVAANA